MINEFAKQVLGLDTTKFSSLTIKSTNNFLLVVGRLPNGAHVKTRFYRRNNIYYKFQRSSFFPKEERNQHILDLSAVLTRVEIAELLNVSASTVRNITVEAQCQKTGLL